MPLSFILVEPSRATNVGAAARALKTMGFNQLVLVNSDLHLHQEAQWVAHGADDILQNTCVHQSLTSIRQEYDILIGCTARERGQPRTYLTPDELKPYLTDYQSAKVGIVFGRESSGLSNEELALCDIYSYVPLKQSYPSMNLAQAVMVYSYALSQIDHNIGLQQTPADPAQLKALKHKAEQLLDTIALHENDKLRSWLLDAVVKLQSRDCKMAHQLINDLVRHLGSVDME